MADENEGLQLRYFILKPRAKNRDDIHALASQEAMLAYADRIEEINETFARELRDWSVGERLAQEYLKELG